MPTPSVPSRWNSLTPREADQRRTSAVAMAPRSPAPRSGENPPIATLIATWLTPQQAQHRVMITTAVASMRS
jgi:hypothetical protein